MMDWKTCVFMCVVAVGITAATCTLITQTSSCQRQRNTEWEQTRQKAMEKGIPFIEHGSGSAIFPRENNAQ